jgi:SAM-dependent MidA family methyltransferase
VEVRVGVAADGAFVEVEAPWARQSLRPPTLAEGHGSTVPVHAFALLDTVATRLRRGSVLLIDYGSPDGPGGAVHGYREHRAIADVLSDPGGTDITAGVDWTLVANHARACGFQVLGPIRQSEALRALGLARWERSMRERQSVLQRADRGSEAVRVWEARSRASLLADPSGLGVLVAR